jgi:hypothetical protein
MNLTDAVNLGKDEDMPVTVPNFGIEQCAEASL